MSCDLNHTFTFLFDDELVISMTIFFPKEWDEYLNKILAVDLLLIFSGRLLLLL